MADQKIAEHDGCASPSEAARERSRTNRASASLQGRSSEEQYYISILIVLVVCMLHGEKALSACILHPASFCLFPVLTSR